MVVDVLDLATDKKALLSAALPRSIFSSVSVIATVSQIASTAVVATSFGVWARGKLLTRREKATAIEQRTWHDYIEPAGINTWPVRLMEIPDRPTARVVLEVVGKDGAPDANWADNMRNRVQGDGLLARAPTQAETKFLIALRKERFNRGGPIQ